MARPNQSVELPKWVLRFNVQQRFQHGVLALSVLMLIITGFPIKYANQPWAVYVVNLFGSFENMFRVHLGFAVVLILISLYHVLWLLLRRKEANLSAGAAWERLANPVQSRLAEWSMMPTYKDFQDAVHHIRYLLGLEAKPPQFGRYTWLEKFEYFAVIWGVIVMGGSGIILWFPQVFIFLPRWAFDVARVVHSNEAFVCFLAIVVGHFYFSHFNPRVFPSSPVWYRGTISLEHLKEEHPLEYEQLKQAYGGNVKEPHLEESRWARCRPLIALELVIYAAVFILLLATFIPMLFQDLV